MHECSLIIKIEHYDSYEGWIQLAKYFLKMVFNTDTYLTIYFLYLYSGPLWSWLYGSWIYNYLCNQCLSPLKLWVRILLMRGVLDATICDKVWSVTCSRSVVFSGYSNQTKPNQPILILVSYRFCTKCVKLQRKDEDKADIFRSPPWILAALLICNAGLLLVDRILFLIFRNVHVKYTDSMYYWWFVHFPFDLSMRWYL